MALGKYNTAVLVILITILKVTYSLSTLEPEADPGGGLLLLTTNSKPITLKIIREYLSKFTKRTRI